jgi:hypothetical protein
MKSLTRKATDAQVGALRLRLEGEDLGDEGEHVLLALLGRHELLDAIGEDDEPDAIVVLDGGEGEQRRHLGGDLALGLLARAEGARAAGVDQQHHRHLALLDEELDVGLAHARRDVPVDEADVVAGLILAHLGEGHAQALEDRVVGAGQLVLRLSRRHDLDAADLLYQLARQHGG